MSRGGAPPQGDHKGTTLLCLRIGLAGPSIGVGPGRGDNRVAMAFAYTGLYGRPLWVAGRRWSIDGWAASPPPGDHKGPPHIHSATIAPTGVDAYGVTSKGYPRGRPVLLKNLQAR
jgi:hypothetical protein